MNDGYSSAFSPDFADTGQWKLSIHISSAGISAQIDPVEPSEQKPLVLFSRTWKEDSSKLMANIESAIYDNPRVLDDFATRVIIDTPKSLWIPVEFTDDDEFDPELFTAVYPANDGDIFADFHDDEVCLYTLAPGLKSFLNRTLPGARISCRLSVEKDFIEAGNHPALADEYSRDVIVVFPVKGEFDLFVYSGQQMMCGATHSCRNSADAAYFIMLAVKAYGLIPDATTVVIAGEQELTHPLREALEDLVAVTTIHLPRL